MHKSCRRCNKNCEGSYCSVSCWVADVIDGKSRLDESMEKVLGRNTARNSTAKAVSFLKNSDDEVTITIRRKILWRR